MNIPDVAGFILGDAVRALEDTGIYIKHISVTSPPKQRTCEYNDDCRVIKVKINHDESVELLVCKPL